MSRELTSESCQVPWSEPSLLLARISGLPASAIHPLSSGLCREWLAAESSLEQEVAATRAELVDRLFGLVRLASPPLRRFLLSVKRDAFNARPLFPHRADVQWSELSRLASPVAERLADLEARLEGVRQGYAAAYRTVREREHQALLDTLADSGFRRGLALASPVLAEAADKVRSAQPDAPSPREARLDLGLLRYVSRAAVKLSPFSTLTRIAVGRVEGNESAPLSWTGGAWRERSLLRVQRYLIEQDVEVLCRYRPLREGLIVTLNSTLQETAPPGRYRFLRPERLVPDAKAGRLRHDNAALAEINLPDALTGAVFGPLRHGPRAYRDLAACLTEDLGGAATSALESLIESGVLVLQTPWPSNAPHLEKTLLSHLRALPHDAGLAAVIAALDRLVALEEGFPAAPRPARSVAEIDGALDDLWRAAVRLVGLEPGIERWRNRPGDVREDVLLLPAKEKAQEIFRVSQSAVREIVRSAASWARLTAFQNHRLDFLITLGAFLRRTWPGRTTVGFLELFAAAQPLWREFRKLTASGTDSQSAFNPLGLTEVAELARLRQEIWAGLRKTVASLPAGEPLPLEALKELALRIPDRWASPLGPCLFVQPAEATGSLWVLNRIFEGTGRYSSRFTAIMDEDGRRQFAGRFAGASTDLLDLLWSRHDTLNVHAVQTARVLAIPGETLDRADAVVTELCDLSVSLDQDGLPRLVDTAGRHLLPVHLGGATSRRMPFLVQFLSCFGPGEIFPLRSPVPVRRQGDVEIVERLTAGCLVLARRRWIASLGEDLRRLAATAPDEAVFAAVNRWRMSRNLPERLFLIEKTHYESVGFVYKPQYLDFTSPLLVELLRSALRLNKDPLIFEEALPAWSDLPQGPAGDRWAVEVHLDTLTLKLEEINVESLTSAWCCSAALQ